MMSTLSKASAQQRSRSSKPPPRSTDTASHDFLAHKPSCCVCCSVDYVRLLAQGPAMQRLQQEMLRARRATVRGAFGPVASLTAAAVHQAAQCPVLLVTAHVDDADDALDELTALGTPAYRLPALETLPGESTIALDLIAERLAAVRMLALWNQSSTLASPQESATKPASSGVIVAPIAALMQGVPSVHHLERLLRTLRTGERVQGGPQGLSRWLDAAGYERVQSIEEAGQYAVRGGIVDLFPPGDPSLGAADVSMGGAPIRCDFFGDEIETLAEIDINSMAIDRKLQSAMVVCASPDLLRQVSSQNPAELIPKTTITLLHELLEITEQGRGYYERVVDPTGIFGPPAVMKALVQQSTAVVELTALGQYASGDEHVIDLPTSHLPPLDQDLATAIKQLADLARGDPQAGEPSRVVDIWCSTKAEEQRLHELIKEHAPRALDDDHLRTHVGYLRSGLVLTGSLTHGSSAEYLIVPYAELVHRFMARRRTRASKLRAGRSIDTFIELNVGDYVVHQEHGIARYLGLKWMAPHEVQEGTSKLTTKLAGLKSEQAQHEFLTLEFAGSAKLHVPIVKADLVQKYVGGFKGKPRLSQLGSSAWKNQKARVAESVRDLAAELLRVRAARESMPGIAFPSDTPWQQAFEEAFPYEETEDQLAALQEIKRDMQLSRPMDRLLCGDVGFGKTELAIRAAFKAVESGKQVAVLVPTTVLAEQHERTFSQRFADYPFKVASISRFKSDSDVKRVLDDLVFGKVDVIIGTHRLLSKDVTFKDLGLVIIDEEQRFGVEHKESLLRLRLTADILTLSATPIPRTLHMGMMGLRDISSLTTAPVDRRAVVTEVIPYNPARLRQIIDRELSRDGQVFYVHNRVYDILSVADEVQKMAPKARIVVGHGQMPPHELEEVMLAFMTRRADILVSTTIIESGIDIPTANTMIIEDADHFGLAELHQLRGRVGRSKHRGYCYLLQPDGRPMREKAKQRLKALEQYAMLGAGFKIAMRDLEIRGAGNILGPEQSGHIAAVGYDMYCQLLERETKGLRNEITTAPSELSLEVGIAGQIPKAYIPADLRRLEAYRRVALASTQEEVAKAREDLIGAYGPLPESAQALLDLAELRVACRDLAVRGVTVRSPDVIFRTHEPADLADLLRAGPGKVTILPPSEKGQLAEVYLRPDSPAMLEGSTLMAVLRQRLIRRPQATAITATASSKPEVRSPKIVIQPMLTPPASKPATASQPPKGKPKLNTTLKNVKRLIREARRQDPGT